MRGNVLRAMGGREQEGIARQALTFEERKMVEERLKRKREEKMMAGKNTYQPKK